MSGDAPGREAGRWIERLGLERHPEGGWFRETWRGPAAADGRAVGTSIYFLLARGRTSRWHRLDADEVWHFHAGSPLALDVALDGAREELRLGPGEGARPQRVVPAGAWQRARSLGDWTLVGTTMAPGFTVEGFELAPEGWTPPARAEST